MNGPRRPRWTFFGLGLLAGVLALGAVRFAVARPAPITHYHANWAIVVDGAPLDLSAARYMEDVARCKADPTHMDPQDRVHLHERVGDAVHVHAGGATWGHLLANLGFALGRDWLVTDAGVRYESAPPRTLKFVLNGQPVAEVHNRTIRSTDRLLISYGAEPLDSVVRTQFPHVASTAARLNTLPDPASCSGPAEPTLTDRLRRAFWR